MRPLELARREPGAMGSLRTAREAAKRAVGRLLTMVVAAVVICVPVGGAVAAPAANSAFTDGSVAYSYDAPALSSLNSAAREWRRSTAPYVYDAPALLSSQSAGASCVRGSPSGPEAVSRTRSVFVRDRGVAAKSLSALEEGAAKVPSAWGEGIANSKGVGTRWFDPAAPQTNGIRIDAGNPGSSWASQQVDHVVVRSGGRTLGPDGKPITGALRDNPQAHIPLSDWLNWTSWNAP